MKKTLFTVLILLSLSIAASNSSESWTISHYLTVSPPKKLLLSFDKIMDEKLYHHPINKNIVFTFYDENKESSDTDNPIDVIKLFNAFEFNPVVFGWGDSRLNFLLISTKMAYGRNYRRQIETIENELKRQSDNNTFITLSSNEYQTKSNVKVFSTTYQTIVDGKKYIQIHHLINERQGAYNIIIYPIDSDNYKKINKTVTQIVKTAELQKYTFKNNRE